MITAVATELVDEDDGDTVGISDAVEVADATLGLTNWETNTDDVDETVTVLLSEDAEDESTLELPVPAAEVEVVSDGVFTIVAETLNDGAILPVGDSDEVTLTRTVALAVDVIVDDELGEWLELPVTVTEVEGLTVAV